MERAFVLLGDQGALQEWGYVACSRARTETRLYLASPTLEPDVHGRVPNVDDAPERLARALSASASEPLAVAQLEPTKRATDRVRAAREGQLAQERARAEQRLAEAQKKLDRLGWRARGRRGAEFRTEINLQRAALRLADQRLSEPISAPRTEPLRADRDAVVLTREGSVCRRLAREAFGRARPPERERGFGIEL